MATPYAFPSSSSSAIKSKAADQHASHSCSLIRQLSVVPYATDITRTAFWEKLHCKPEEYHAPAADLFYTAIDDTIVSNLAKVFCEYANLVSQKVHDALGEASKPLILFEDTRKLILEGHPTATTWRPAVVARCTSAHLHWANIEATVEIQSKCKNLKHREGQETAYTPFLLQARPDRNSVLGLYVDKDGLVFMITNAEGVKRTNLVPWKDEDSTRLLYAFITRLYTPHNTMVDPTVERVQGRPGFFNITLTLEDGGKTTCLGYPHCISFSPFNRRTTIFIKKDSPAVINGKPIPVIKEQYRAPDRHFEESTIIKHIHKDGPFPGVIQIINHEVVMTSEGTEVSSGTCSKVRLAEKDCGTPFMDIKTPREVLFICYDLLEITRCLYRDRKVLHRDISDGNVLVFKHRRDNEHPIATEEAVDVKDADASEKRVSFVSINRLLDSTKDRCATNTLMIDFEHGEITDRSIDAPRLERIGTLRFMARAVRSGAPLPVDPRLGIIAFPSIPKFETDEMCQIYSKSHPERVSKFDEANDFLPIMISNLDKTKVYRHELRHDAESIFWLLFWWSIRACPQGDGEPSLIPANIWASMTETSCDIRGGSFYNSDNDALLDDQYADLLTLLRSLAGELLTIPDRHWATGVHADPEFIHEALQRHILNFLVKHKDDTFMDLPTRDQHRAPEQLLSSVRLTGSRSESYFTSSQSSGPSIMRKLQRY